MGLVHTVRRVTAPQDPWQQGGYGQYPQGGYPPPGTPSGGFAQQGNHVPYPQATYPGGGYAAPQVPGGAVPERPVSVEAAFWISVVAPVLATVMMVLGFLSVWPMLSSLQDAEVQGIVGTFALSGLVLLTIFFLVLTALWIVFGFQLRAGRNWARVLLTVVGVFWLIWSVTRLITGGSMFALPADKLPVMATVMSYAHNGVSVLSMIAFLVLVFLPVSNQYFQTAHRRY